MNKFVSVAAFAAGAALGIAGTWRYFKCKYEKLVQEEVDSVKSTYKKYRDKQESEDTKPTAEIYSDEKPVAEKSEEKEERTVYSRPYVISPDEFGEIEDYDKISLTYYADEVLTDECDEVIEDADEVVGLDSLKHFGEYEDDSVFVRNDRLKADYEILADHRTYSDVCKAKPYGARKV